MLRNAAELLNEQNVSSPERAQQLLSSTQFQQQLTNRIAGNRGLNLQQADMLNTLQTEQENIKEILRQKAAFTQESTWGKMGRWAKNTGSYLLDNAKWILPLAVVGTVGGVVGYRYLRDYIEGLGHLHSADLSGQMIEQAAKANYAARPAMGRGESVHTQTGMSGRAIYTPPTGGGIPLPDNLPDFPAAPTPSPGNPQR